jgi:hypothetical protein
VATPDILFRLGDVLRVGQDALAPREGVSSGIHEDIGAVLAWWMVLPVELS